MENRVLLTIVISSISLFSGCLQDSEGPLVPLASPEEVTASQGVFRDAVDLSWSSVSGARCYRVYRTDDGDGEYSIIYECDADTVSGRDQITGSGETIPGTAYSYRVAAVDPSGNEGLLSEPVSGWAFVSFTPQDFELTYEYLAAPPVPEGAPAEYRITVRYDRTADLSIRREGFETSSWAFEAADLDIEAAYSMAVDGELLRMFVEEGKTIYEDRVSILADGCGYETPFRCDPAVHDTVVLIGAFLESLVPPEFAAELP